MLDTRRQDSTPETDQHTVDYFDTQQLDYWVERFEFAAEAIRRLASPDCSLVDVGCGTGNTLEYLRRETGIERVCGMDVSPNCLEHVRARLNCETIHGSVLDAACLGPLEGRFDFAVLAAVLHHLVGRSRTASRAQATQAVANTLRLVKPGGHLIIIEPVFYPAFMMDVVFYVKRLVTTLVPGRIELFGQEANNIGAPVVSYYTTEVVQEMVHAADGAELLETHCLPRPLGRLYRLALIRRRDEATFVIRKPAA